ncbi:hypothetical protein ACFY7C_12830 [Streptomyces sp. NPDC012769]|uniref:hypothetical protein n=1 Tax=Streptomyces sp. NPDC012769 TaxID=3364848 RepID=UPI0036827203
MRRENLPGAVVLTGHADRLPALRLETAPGGRMLLRQGARPVLLARLDGDRHGVTVHRRDGYRSPLPPLRVDEARQSPDWPHRFASGLAASDRGPLHADRLLLTRRSGFPPYVWHDDLVRDWPTVHLDHDRTGWNGVLPLRPLSAADAPRVKAYRRQAREGVLPPVLLWSIPEFDGWLVLDGHDRAVAALAEGRDPDAVVLARGEDEETRATAYEAVSASFERRLADIPPGQGPARRALTRSHAAALASVPYDEAPTPTWPISGGAAAWDAWMLEFRHEHDCH